MRRCVSRSILPIATIRNRLICNQSGQEIVVVKSQHVDVRKSVFVAWGARGMETPEDVRVFREYVESQLDADVTHKFIHAYILPPSDGASVGVARCGDDGEKGAGNVILRAIRSHGTFNQLCVGGGQGICVAVSRWYGGVQLGSKRFSVISGVAREVMDKF